VRCKRKVRGCRGHAVRRCGATESCWARKTGTDEGGKSTINDQRMRQASNGRIKKEKGGGRQWLGWFGVRVRAARGSYRASSQQVLHMRHLFWKGSTRALRQHRKQLREPERAFAEPLHTSAMTSGWASCRRVPPTQAHRHSFTPFVLSRAAVAAVNVVAGLRYAGYASAIWCGSALGVWNIGSAD
jgi:hypothetical protein